MAQFVLAKNPTKFAYGTALKGSNAFEVERHIYGQMSGTLSVSLHVKHDSPDSMPAILFCSAIYELCGRCRGYFQCMRAVNKNDLRACSTASVEDGIANQTCLASCLHLTLQQAPDFT